ncbi:hypothetical protein [Yoonia sp. 2307UL14-13]|uniref:hypothetical protein n=1 Tax=Yoonia sp. 2307UL14-13 TaxID=3126506 RepID=UPI0030A9F7ED
MSSIAIDTNQAIQRLEAKGFSRAQAEGVVEVLTESRLVTIDVLDQRFDRFRGEMYKAMLIQTGTIIAGILGIITLLQ